MTNQWQAPKGPPAPPATWAGRAACKGRDVFYPADSLRGPAKARAFERAKRVCDGCPVRAVCLRWALDVDERHGVWGGMDPEERAVIRAAHASVPARVDRRRRPDRLLASAGG